VLRLVNIKRVGATLSKGWVRQLVKGGATFIRTLCRRFRFVSTSDTLMYFKKISLCPYMLPHTGAGTSSTPTPNYSVFMDEFPALTRRNSNIHTCAI
jgi:hypothetical protein